MSNCVMHGLAAVLGEPLPLSALVGRVDPADLDALVADGLAIYRESDEAVAALAKRALEASLAAAGLVDADIDLIIYASQMRGEGEASLEQLCAETGFGRTPMLSICTGGCAAAPIALRLAAAMIDAGEARHVAIVTADGAGAHGPRLTRLASAVLSDGAAAAVVSRAGRAGWRVVSCRQRDDHRIRAMAGPADAPLRTALAARGLRQVVEEALAAAGVTVSDIGAILASNLRRSIADRYLTAAGLPIDKLYTATLADISHAFSADPLINLAHRAAARSPDAEPLLLLGLSFNSWAAAVIRWDAGAAA